MLFGVFITPLSNCCPKGVFRKPLDLSLLPIHLIDYFSRMVKFSFEKITVCPVSHSFPTGTKALVVSSENFSHLFASSDKLGMLSDA